MAGTIQCGRRSRKDFGKIPSIVEIPNLIEVQQRSDETCLQQDAAPDRREEIGLQAVFKSVFPIEDYNGNARLEFDSYHFGDPKYTVEECHDRGMTFAIPLKVTLRLVVFDHDKEAKTRTIREQRGQEVYLGELPLMTSKGTFIINGTERVVVSQLQRSAGVFFDDDKGKTLASGKLLFSARIIPYRGSWVEFDFDANDILHVRVDRRRKMLATAFLRAFWFLEKGVILSDEEILGHFYDGEEVLGFEEGNAWVKLHPEAHVGARGAADRRAHRGRRERRGARPDEHRDHLPDALADHGPAGGAVQAARERRRQDRSVHVRNPGARPLQEPRRGARRDLPTAPAGRSTYRGVRARSVPGYVHGPAALRPRARRTVHDQQEAADRGAALRQDAAQRGYRGGDPPPPHGQARLQVDRRYRPPRQPPRPVCRRTAREPVPRGPDADGACGEGTDVHLGHHKPDAARPHQREASLGGREGVLRVVAALAVHGSGEPAGGADPQAPPLGVGSAGPLPRAGGVRGARRPPDALRPDLPDRDAGRPEPRPDLVALDLRADERVRLHRDALPEGRPGTRHRRDRVPDGARGGAVRHRPGQRRDRPERPLRPGAGLGAQGRRVPHGPARGAALHGRVAEAARLGGRLADPVHRERRREPRVHGVKQHS